MNEPPNPEVAVFAAALELPADQRGTYLDRACAGDAVLRRQVEALLRVHDDAGNFFDKLSSVARPTSADGPMLGSSGTDPIPGIPAEKPGDRIGRYKLLQQIGEGGCGVVYMAEQEEPVRRRVALKVIKLGVLLYELLTAKTPFDANRLVEAGLDEIRRIIREEEPMRPSTKLQTLNAAEQTSVARHRHSEPPRLLGIIRGDLDFRSP